MKTKISGWLALILSFVAFLFFAVMLSNPSDYSSQEIARSVAQAGVIMLIVSIVIFVCAIGIIMFRKWAWYLGVFISTIITIANVYYLIKEINYWPMYSVLVAVNLFVLYSLISERNLVLKKK